MDPPSTDLSRTRLDISLEPRYLHLLTGFVEEAARAQGLGTGEALALTLAAEEIFSYLTGGPAYGRELRVECRGCLFQVTLDILFATTDLDLRLFNLTSRVEVTGEELPPAIGLLIAAREVDRLRLRHESGLFRLTLSKDKVYPPLEAGPPPPPARPASACRAPDAAELYLLLQGVNANSPGMLPADFDRPAKVADMLAAGACRALIAVDAAGRIGGGLLWQGRGERLVECFGPYLFGQPATTAQLLLDHLLAALARQPGHGLLNRYPASLLPPGYFEVLGARKHYYGGDRIADIPVYYRHLLEDLGALTWTHPALRPYLEAEYRRLAFARDLVAVGEGVLSQSPYSVLTVAFNRLADEVTLTPVWWGRDAPENLVRHLEMLRGEGLNNLFFQMDLGHAWQTLFTPAVLAAGFRPTVLLPHAGKGDLLLFQHEPGAAPGEHPAGASSGSGVLPIGEQPGQGVARGEGREDGSAVAGQPPSGQSAGGEVRAG